MRLCSDEDPEPLDDPRDLGTLVLRGRVAAETARREAARGDPMGRKAGGEAPKEAGEAAGTGRSVSVAVKGIDADGTGVRASSTGSRLAGLAAVKLDGRACGVDTLREG